MSLLKTEDRGGKGEEGEGESGGRRKKDHHVKRDPLYDCMFLVGSDDFDSLVRLRRGEEFRSIGDPSSTCSFPLGEDVSNAHCEKTGSSQGRGGGGGDRQSDEEEDIPGEERLSQRVEMAAPSQRLQKALLPGNALSAEKRKRLKMIRSSSPTPVFPLLPQQTKLLKKLTQSRLDELRGRYPKRGIIPTNQTRSTDQMEKWILERDKNMNPNGKNLEIVHELRDVHNKSAAS